MSVVRYVCSDSRLRPTDARFGGDALDWPPRWGYYDENGRCKPVTTKELIEAVVSLPVEERAFVADSVLRSLNAPDSEIDRKWAQVAQRRLAELRCGEVKPIAGEEVFTRIWKRFEG
jgi:hypothetical protein